MFFLLACAPADKAFLVGSAGLVAEPAVLDFGAVGYLFRAERILQLHNRGANGIQVSISVQGDQFTSTESELWLGDGELRELAIWYEPIGLDREEGLITLTGYEEATEQYQGVTTQLLASTDADVDDDGYTAQGLGGDDCNDTDPSINPTGEEYWYDGVDQDCDGGSDYDADGDGYDLEPPGLDCDDEDEAIKPGAVEQWYDGVDQDCTGVSDYDADGDGHDAEPWGVDCDDTDPTRVVGC